MGHNNPLHEAKLYITNLPKYLNDYRERQKINKKRAEYTREIFNAKESVLETLPDAADCLACIEKYNTITYFNSEFEKNRDLFSTPVYTDEKSGLKYVLENNKRLYYPADFSNRHISYCYQSILIEQNTKSPHLYLDEGEDLRNVILFDCGSAEGSLTFSHIEELRHAYLFEGDGHWINALNATFEPWKDKVTVENGFLGVQEGQISLKQYITDLIEQGELDCAKDDVFIKMDVESAEPDLLSDIASLLERFSNIRLAVCVYHKHDDERKVIEAIPSGFKYRARDGYMLFYEYEDSLIFPYFRHGVLRIER